MMQKEKDISEIVSPCPADPTVPSMTYASERPRVLYKVEQVWWRESAACVARERADREYAATRVVHTAGLPLVPAAYELVEV